MDCPEYASEEYKDFKNFLLSSSPHIYYLLMDKFLKSRLSFFSNIISDILVSSKPAIADQIAEQMKATGTLEESFYLYPQLCLDIWLDALDTQ